MDFVDKSPLLASLNYAKGQMLYRLGLRKHLSGSTAYGSHIEESVRYINRVVEDYLCYGAAGDAGHIRGKNVLEIGPGDNLGVGLILLAMGAESVTCLDGFAPCSNPAKNRRIYAALHRAMTEEQRGRVKDTVREDSDGGISLHGRRLTAHYESPLERDHSALQPDSYDIIVSRAVLEHLADIRRGWARMVRTLKPKGEMWHKVDFRSHKMFERIHPLYFLTFRERWWRLVSSPDPTLNRARLPVYRELTARDFESSEIYFTHILEDHEIEPHTKSLVLGKHYGDQQVELVRAIRPFLKEPFSAYTDEDLVISGVFVISRDKHTMG